MPRPQMEASIDTKLLVERLKKLNPGDLVNYDDLSSVISRDVRDAGYSSLQSARRILRSGSQGVRMHFSAVPNQGMQRMPDHELAHSGTETMGRIRRVAHKGTQILACVEHFDKLPNEDKVAHNASLSLLGAIKQATHANSIKKIEHAVEKSAGQPLAIGKTLGLFTSG